MVKSKDKIVCLKYIIQARHSKQYYLAEKMGIAPQQFTKYYKREKPIKEEYIEFLEKELKVDRDYWIDSRRKCLELTEERRLKLEEYFFEENRGNIINVNESEQEFYNNVKLRKMYSDLVKSVYQYSEIEDLNIVMENASAEIAFYQNIIKLKNNTSINNVIWESIIRALEMYSNQVEHSYISSYDLANTLCEILLEENRRCKKDNEDDIRTLKELLDIDSSDVQEEIN